jgi:hypothetical protein
MDKTGQPRATATDEATLTIDGRSVSIAAGQVAAP